MSTFHMVFSVVVWTILFGCSTANKIAVDQRKEYTRPLNIAHRGSAGILPENTLEAFTLAIEQNSDLLEVDIALTRDFHVVCIHESWLSLVTDVADKFDEERKATRYIIDDDATITDWFTVDFTLEEIRTLGVKQRFTYRDQSFDFEFGIPTLQEYIEAAQASGTSVGLLVELKDPKFVNAEPYMQEAGFTFEEILIDVLNQYGYTEPTDPVIVQSFDEASLIFMQTLTNLRLGMLLEAGFDATEEDLDRYASFAYSIGPSKTSIVKVDPITNKISEITSFVEQAQERGMLVFPYTFRNENQHLAFDYLQDPNDEYLTFINLGVDGLISDHPHTVDRLLNCLQQ